MTALEASLRPLRLVPWLVRTLVPERYVGTYALHQDGDVVYVGRSDDLRSRLIVHAENRRADFFTYDVHKSSLHAFEVESALYHILSGSITNRIHPAAPKKSGATCPFCRAAALESLAERIDLRTHFDHATAV
jgi:hypothetical protein